MNAAHDNPSPRAVWRVMSDLVLDHNRKLKVQEELGLSFARIRALRRMTEGPHTMGDLAELLAADPPYVTLIVDDLERRKLVTRTPHPTDRRAKLVELTAAGRKIAARADKLLYTPPDWVNELSTKDLAALLRILGTLDK